MPKIWDAMSYVGAEAAGSTSNVIINQIRNIFRRYLLHGAKILLEKDNQGGFRLEGRHKNRFAGVTIVFCAFFS